MYQSELKKSNSAYKKSNISMPFSIRSAKSNYPLGVDLDLHKNLKK